MIDEPPITGADPRVSARGLRRRPILALGVDAERDAAISPRLRIPRPAGRIRVVGGGVRGLASLGVDSAVQTFGTELP
jgi:hypothetical protein